MSNFMDKVERLTNRIHRAAQLIRYAQDMYSMLNDAMKALRIAGSGDTRYAMRQASDIERLIRRIDGKKNSYD